MLVMLVKRIYSVLLALPPSYSFRKVTVEMNNFGDDRSQGAADQILVEPEKVSAMTDCKNMILESVFNELK